MQGMHRMCWIERGVPICIGTLPPRDTPLFRDHRSQRVQVRLQHPLLSLVFDEKKLSVGLIKMTRGHVEVAATPARGAKAPRRQA